MDLLRLGVGTDIGAVDTSVPDDELVAANRRLEAAFGENTEKSIVAMFPGAAFGPSKRWPVERFAEVGKRLVAESNCLIVVAGTAADSAAGCAIADTIGEGALDLTGETSMTELAAMLALCDVVVANDSGGMHLATLVGTKVAAIYGVTDPDKTGPIGQRHRIIAAEDVTRSRDLDRNSDIGQRALASISPDKVIESIRELLG
jgi:lipopolysaccharide heptosyltransferase II